MILSIAIIALYIVLPAISYAALSSQYTTTSFGGKVLTPQFSVADCVGFGTGPVVLNTNVSSLGSAVISSVGGGQPVQTRNNNVASGIYGAIPFYAQLSFTPGSSLGFVAPLPKAGDWILGRASIIPSLNRCLIKNTVIPFPVRNTNTYNISR